MRGQPIARCFIKKEDPDHCLYLTDEIFVLKIKGKAYTYELERIKQLYWAEKKLLLPIISGGLISTLSIIAYYNDFMRGEFLIMLLLAGVLLLYLGFTGSPALVVQLKNSEENYLLFKHNAYLQSFTDFVNQFLVMKKEPDYYLELDTHEWEQLQAAGYINITDKRELLQDGTQPDKEKTLIRVDIRQLQASVVYLPDANNTLIPYVTENIPLSAVTQKG